MVGEGPPSTPCGADFSRRCGRRAFARHDGIATTTAISTPMRRRPAIHALRCRYQQRAWMAARSLCPGLSWVAAMTILAGRLFLNGVSTDLQSAATEWAGGTVVAVASWWASGLDPGSRH